LPQSRGDVVKRKSSKIVFADWPVAQQLPGSRRRSAVGTALRLPRTRLPGMPCCYRPRPFDSHVLVGVVKPTLESKSLNISTAVDLRRSGNSGDWPDAPQKLMEGGKH
jgi:hypothetical protein